MWTSTADPQSSWVRIAVGAASSSLGYGERWTLLWPSSRFRDAPRGREPARPRCRAKSTRPARVQRDRSLLPARAFPEHGEPVGLVLNVEVAVPARVARENRQRVRAGEQRVA